MTTYASLVEIIWSFTSILGLGASIPSLVDTWSELKNIKKTNSIPIVKMMAKSNLRNELFRAITFFIFSLVGIVSMLIPNNTSRPGDWRQLLVWGLVAVNVGMLYNTIQDRRMRKALVKYYNGNGGNNGSVQS